MHTCYISAHILYICTHTQNGPIGPLHHVFLAWCLRELWTFPLFLAGIWSREVAWKDQRYKLQFGGKAIKLD